MFNYLFITIPTFNINNVNDKKTLIICEGEVDALSWLTVLKDNDNIGVVSVPNGAPLKVSEEVVEPSEDKKYKYKKFISKKNKKLINKKIFTPVD